MSVHKHDCPGGCGRQIANQRFACPFDWYRLPTSIRRRISLAWRDKDHEGHRVAAEGAHAWYAGNPPSESRSKPRSAQG